MTKIILIVVGSIIILLILAAIIFLKPMVMSIYNDNFGKRFTTYEPLAWSLEDFEGLLFLYWSAKISLIFR